jgi:hypothetical protein
VFDFSNGGVYYTARHEKSPALDQQPGHDQEARFLMTASVTHDPTGGEGILTKARRLAPTVEHKHGAFFQVGKHHLMVAESDIHCSCKASSFGVGCSHRLAVEIHLSGTGAA